MSVVDTNGLIPVYTPELSAVPTAPATPAVPEAAGGSTEDSGSSTGSMSAESEESAAVVELGIGGSSVSPYRSAQAQAAATVLDMSGASSVTVDDYELSVPPNLASASALVSQLTANADASTAAMAAAYQLLTADTTLALTSD